MGHRVGGETAHSARARAGQGRSGDAAGGWSPGAAGRAVVIVAFLFLTAPVAAHAIGRAGYRRGSPLWEAPSPTSSTARKRIAGIDRLF